MNSNNNRKSGLPALVGDNPKILILGSLPSDQSIARQEYYANPRNLFWKVMAGVFDDSVPESYELKKEYIVSRHISLWDVFASAERDGSLDANIREMAYNDIAGFLKEHPSIKVIALNGGKASKAFQKMSKHCLDDFGSVTMLPLTSTSALSLSAGWPLERIIEQWKQILKAYEEV